MAHDPSSVALHLSNRDKKKLAKEVKRTKELSFLIGGKAGSELPRGEGDTSRDSSGQASDGQPSRKSSSRRRRERQKRASAQLHQRSESASAPKAESSRSPASSKPNGKVGAGAGKQ